MLVQDALDMEISRLLYRLVSSGYYDPKVCADGKRTLLWYEGATLKVQTIFMRGRCVFVLLATLSCFWLEF